MFPAKLFLFGEYSILLGSPALSVPFSRFSASLKFIDDEHCDVMVAGESNIRLKGLHDHCLSNANDFGEFLDIKAFGRDLACGLYLSSTIPQRYGMGSSGALCAAVYDRYGLDQSPTKQSHGSIDIRLIRTRFSVMESFFHGKSSGFDPLVSFLGSPLHLTGEGEVAALDMKFPAGHSTLPATLLVDSGLPCSTGPLVADFLDAFAPGGRMADRGAELCNIVGAVMEKLVVGDAGALWLEINRLSMFQLTNMDHLIPAFLRPAWNHGLESGLFALKLCGSGGGGFLICFTHHREESIRYFNNLGLVVLDPQLLSFETAS
jgi:mevalonate kinase